MKLTKQTRKLLITTIIAFVIPFALNFLGSFSLNQQYITSLENALYDTSFRWFMDDSFEEPNFEEVESRIVFVDIDETSLSKLGPYWQWPRTHHAEVVRQLSRGGAAAITFDILFKKAFFGTSKTDQAVHMLKNVLPDINWDTYYNDIRPYYNHDSIFVSEVAEAGNVVIAATVGRSVMYLHESQWRPLSTPQWNDTISPHSAYVTAQTFDINNWDILDNVFPELGQAAHTIGLVNVIPDEDGVHRSEYLLQGFPNPSINFSYTPGLYPVIALQTALLATGTSPQDITIDPGNSLKIGPPVTLIKDSFGSLSTSYPNLTWTMLRELLKKRKMVRAQQENDTNFRHLTVATQVIVTKEKNGEMHTDIFDAQTLSHPMTQAILNTPTLDSLIQGPQDVAHTLSHGVTLSYDEDEGFFMLTDNDDDETYINSYVIQTLQEEAQQLSALPVGHIAHLASNLTLYRHRYTGTYQSNFILLNESSINALLNNGIETINALPNGSRLSLGDSLLIPITAEGRMRINFSHHSRNTYAGRSNKGFATISYYDVVSGRIDPGYYQGKIFILGSSAAALMDIVSAAPSSDFPGVLIHLNMLENILNSNYIRFIDDNLLLLLMLLCSIVTAFLASYIRPYITVILIAIIGLGLFIYNLETMINGTYMALAKPYLVLILSLFTTIIFRYIFEEREKKQAVDAFKNYISPELIDEMLANDQKPSLGGEENFITAYFTDIASFSTFSEKIGSPSKLVELLNEYLTAMTTILLEYQGTLDKYEGDAIIAFFGAPVKIDYHAQAACKAALLMQDKLGELRDLWASQGEKWPVIVHGMRMRIGINSGQIVTGNMGSSVRMNYTMMGDAVNLAARLESGAKQYGVYTMCSQETIDATDGTILSRVIDEIKVMGKSEPVITYELLALKENITDILFELVEKFTEARALYTATKWSEAEALFTECLALEPHHPDRAPGCKTTPSHLFIERCQEYATHPPVPKGDVWDGVYTATEK
ncbi:MAG: CHASE2 domain-containing protein [Fibrobacterales bacterium]